MPDSVLQEMSVEKRTALWTRSLTQPNPRTLIVAENQTTIAGFCFFSPTRDEDGKGKRVGEIIALNVHPAHWRSGVGRALCEHVLRESPRRNWTSLTLWVLEGNERACRFYEALGFALDGSERIDVSLVGSPLHEFRYRKTF
jgi:ribosomal protein S18 acetylase RimI-like enzyme